MRALILQIDVLLVMRREENDKPVSRRKEVRFQQMTSPFLALFVKNRCLKVVRKRERDRDRQTETERDTERLRQTEERDRGGDKDRERQRHRDRGKK